MKKSCCAITFIREAVCWRNLLTAFSVGSVFSASSSEVSPAGSGIVSSVHGMEVSISSVVTGSPASDDSFIKFVISSIVVYPFFNIETVRPFLLFK